MGRGRRNRRPGGGGGGSGGSGGSGVTQLPALPSTAVAAWHSEVTCSAASWTDYIGGRVLAGFNAPTVATDPGFFNGKVVAKTAGSGTAVQWANRAISPALLSAGTRPWIFVVSRVRGVAAANQSMFSFGDSGVAQSSSGVLPFSSKFSAIMNNSLVVPASGPAADTAVHRHKCWFDGTNANFQLDATTYTLASAASLNVNVNAVSIGDIAHASTGGFQGDANVAYALICSAKPSAPEEAALDAWAQAYFGAPP